MLPSYEQLGLLYLGRRFDLASGARLDEPLLYESKDLVTHAVCIGMTGSGKTGLGITVIEEAALDQIPVLAIDPKGDLSNLLLTFPNLAPSDFAPWVDERQAQQETREAAADQVAARWKKGLAEWNQDGSRIARLRSAADVRVYTPGSRAGIPLSVLKSLRAGTDDPEDAATRATTVAASLLALAGVNDPGPHSREHALVAALLSHGGAQIDLPRLVEQILRPPFERIGVMDLESFYPSRDRQELALRFNSVLATPGFDVWMAGEPADPATMLFTPDGRPRIAIVSVAHLDESQRMMAVSLVLNAALEWTRRQGGSPSLRALLYMDEVFGYLPPVANPPSKLPLLTLLKQARAAGVGVMLATQNPVDLDYKALSNTGTWFLGKLQTERDKARVLDGLEGISSSWSRDDLDRTLSGLRSRLFLMHNVHEQEPVTFETRWTLSYLRGPLTREELRKAAGASPVAQTPAAASPAPAAATATTDKPVLPAGITEYFLPATSAPTAYTPVLYGSALVQYSDAKRGVNVTSSVHAVTQMMDGAVAVNWENATPISDAPDALSKVPARSDARFSALPSAAQNPKSYSAWAEDFERWIARSMSLRLFAAPAHKLTSRPGETEAEFKARVQLAVRETRDAAVEKLRVKYASRVAKATDKIRRAEESLEREQQQVSQQKMQTAVSFGATLLGAVMGRKAVSMSTLGRATTAARGVSRSMKEAQDVAQAQERQREAEAELKEIEAELAREVEALQAGGPDITIVTEEIKPRRAGVDVRLVALAWQPLP